MEELGIESYLKLYSEYSGNAGYVSNLTTGSVKFPSIEKFNSYLENYKQQGEISLTSNEEFKRVFESKTGIIWESENYYKIKIRSNLLLKAASPLSNYKSKKFEEVFPKTEYAGHKYLIKAGSREVNIYNLYTNILIASYSAGFALDNKEVPNEDGYFIFYVKKDVFEEEIEKLVISDI
jgi:hypothetical protein